MSCSWIIQKNKEYRSAYGRPFNASLSPINYQKYMYQEERGARSDRGIVEIGTAPSKHRLGPTPPFSRRPPMRRCNGSSFKMWKYMFTAFAPERSAPSLGWMVPREQLFIVVVLYIFVGIRLSCIYGRLYSYCETAHGVRQLDGSKLFHLNTYSTLKYPMSISQDIPQCIRRPQEHV